MKNGRIGENPGFQVRIDWHMQDFIDKVSIFFYFLYSFIACSTFITIGSPKVSGKSKHINPPKTANTPLTTLGSQLAKTDKPSKIGLKIPAIASIQAHIPMAFPRTLVGYNSAIHKYQVDRQPEIVPLPNKALVKPKITQIFSNLSSDSSSQYPKLLKIPDKILNIPEREQRMVAVSFRPKRLFLTIYDRMKNYYWIKFDCIF